ncbi:oligoendopeptidase F [Caldalkalibacillus uzonensis]|uniref:Oligoendopeptidase F n=1 Tax=Caldalkalibacillus uzonensis TaxID=353224 RepID=A0ABU0CNH6_9BACI|nr:M3 family oligoendopeptidase [Caldalkalibacillus uzonensis]MDQ0337970.1 oligoendopeptidase F [Caldalkalibacillus uzonensis]
MFIDDQPAIEYVLPVEMMDHMLALELKADEQHPLLDKHRLEQKLKGLLQKNINSVEELEAWLQEESALSEEVGELAARIHISFKRDHSDAEAKEQYDYLNETLLPMIKRYSFLLDEKFVGSPYLNQLDKERYGELIRSRQNSVQLFKEENIPLEVKERQLVKQYNEIIGSLTVEWEGEERTFQQMQTLLQHAPRDIREKAWRAMWEAVLKEEGKLNGLMSELIELRQQIAKNAGFDNYRDYIYRKYERFDYTPEDSHRLYEAIKKHVVPTVSRLQQEHQSALGLADYKPWDIPAMVPGHQPLKPFEDVDQLIEGTIKIFERLDPQFSFVLKKMDEEGLLDLENRKGKSPGGFCSQLPVTGLSFIFMHATGSGRDVTTMIHEGGHAVHNYLMQRQPLDSYRSADKEVAELASMGMELLTMNEWDVFYKDPEQLHKAQREHLENIISFFPWAMVVDQFQHWMYEHPEHTPEERKLKFRELAQEMSYHGVDTRGLEEILEVRWMLQPHIFEVPFYYIEYVIAQLGALELWADYQQDPQATLTRFKQALGLGSSKPLPEIYQQAGITFDLSEARVAEMVTKVEQALDQLEGHEKVNTN